MTAITWTVLASIVVYRIAARRRRFSHERLQREIPMLRATWYWNGRVID